MAPAPAATTFRVRFYSSSPQRKTARLQRSRGVQAGTECHEGGIILSKKPPEWHLPCRNRRTATTFRVRFYSSSLQRRTARLQRSRGVQAGTGCHEGGIILSKKPPEWHLSPPESTAPPHNTETLTPQLHPQQDLFKLLRPKSCSRIVSER